MSLSRRRECGYNRFDHIDSRNRRNYMKEGFSTLYGYIKRGLKKMAPYYQSFHCQNNWGLEHAKADSTIKKGEVNLRFK